MENKNIEIFERYINNELSLEEAANFSSRLEKDKEFAEDFKLYKEVNETLSHTKVRDFRLLLEQIHEDNFGKKKKKRVLFYRLAAAASFLVIISLSIMFWFNTKNQDKLFSTYYGDMMIMQSQSTENIMLTKAIEAYKAYDFTEAITLFKELTSSESENEMYQFYLALSFMGKEDYTSAQTLLNDSLLKKESLFKDNAQWYLAVTFYKMGKTEKALELFKVIADNPKHYKTKKAQEAVEFLERTIY